MTDEKKISNAKAEEIRKETGTVGKLPGEQGAPASGGGGTDDVDSAAVGDGPSGGAPTGGSVSGGGAVGDTGTNGGGE
jgi:hypothetical protein